MIGSHFDNLTKGLAHAANSFGSSSRRDFLKRLSAQFIALQALPGCSDLASVNQRTEAPLNRRPSLAKESWRFPYKRRVLDIIAPVPAPSRLRTQYVPIRLRTQNSPGYARPKNRLLPADRSVSRPTS